MAVAVARKKALAGRYKSSMVANRNGKKPASLELGEEEEKEEEKLREENRGEWSGVKRYGGDDDGVRLG